MQSLQNYIFQLEDLKNNEKKYTEFIYQNLYSKQEVQELKDTVNLLRLENEGWLEVSRQQNKEIEKLQKENEEHKQKIKDAILKLTKNRFVGMNDEEPIHEDLINVEDLLKELNLE